MPEWDPDHIRIVGCESTNHSRCRGELWGCAGCGKIVCYEEGADDEYPNLCDDCWEKAVTAKGELL